MKNVNPHPAFDTKRVSFLSKLRFLLCASAILLAVTPSHAATVTWTGTTTSDWNTGTNWSGGAIPGSTDNALFNSASPNTSVTMSAATSTGSITFDTNAGAYVIGTTTGNTVILASGGSILTTGTVANSETINAPLSLGGNYTFSSNAAAPFTLNFGGAINLNANTLTLTGTNAGYNIISGAISGAGGLTKTTLGDKWVLAGANTYTGITTVTSGLLQVGNGTSGSISGSSTVRVAGTGILGFDEANGSTISNVINGTANGGQVQGLEDAGITNTLSGGITGGFTTSFTQVGAGTTVISGSGNYTGPTSVSNGTLTFDFATNSISQINGGGKLNVAGGGTFNVNGINGGTTTLTSDLTTIGYGNPANGALGGNASINYNSGTGGTLNVNLGYLNGNVGSTVNFTLPTNGTITGSVVGTSNGGETGPNGIVAGSNGTPYATVGNDWAALTGGTLSGTATINAVLTAGSNVSGFYTAATATTLVGNAQITGANATITLAANTGITSLQDNVAQATTLNLNAKKLTVGGILLGSGVGSNLTTISGGEIDGIGSGALDIIQNNTGGLTISSVIGGTGVLVKTGAALLTISGTSNTYAAQTYINGGTLNIAGDNSLGITPTGTQVKYFNGLNIHISDNAILQTANSMTISSGRGIILENGGGTIDTMGNTVNYGGIIYSSVGGALTKAGSGTLALSGTSSYSTATNITNGTLSISNIANGGTTIGITIGSSVGTLATTTGLVNGTTYTLGGNSASLNEGGTFTYIAGTTAYSIAGTQATGLALLNIGVANALGISSNASTNLTLGSSTGATLQYTGATASTDRLFQLNNTIAGLIDHIDASGTGSLTFSNTGAITYGTANISETLDLTGTNTGINTFNPTIADNGTGATSVTKTGVGTWALGGANTYTGGTTVSTGTLIVSNTTGSAVGTGAFVVNSGATLAGAGKIVTTTNNTINGAVQVGFSGASTNTTDSMTLATTGTTTFTGASLSFNLNGASPGQSNTLNVGSTGKVVFGAGTTLTLNLLNTTTTIGQTLFTLVSTTASGDGVLADQSTFSGDNFTWDATTGEISGLNFSVLNASNPGFYDNSYLVFVGNGNGAFNIDLQVVPEPGTWTLMLGGLALLFVYQRARRSRS